ncbi:MAG TPA: PHB depolymerase family esterase [Labilithrix sp.]|nr:PHB depolymerase family esterase [Labilithrix sp.]
MNYSRLMIGARVVASITLGAFAFGGVGCGPNESSAEPESETSAEDALHGRRQISAVELASSWPIADTERSATANDAHLLGAATIRSAKGATCQPGKRGPRGDFLLTISSGGLPRAALVHVPDDYEPEVGSMLVLNFHGFTSDAAQQAVLSRMNDASDRRNFIAVYPQGIARSWNAGSCCGQAWIDAVDDVAFVRDLLDRLESSWCIDEHRVFATGMSNGGFMSHHLACNLPDRIAAIAPVAGVHGFPSDSCQPKRSIPVLEFHGTWDPLVPYGGGVPLLSLDIPLPISFPPVAKTVTDWKSRNACKGTPKLLFKSSDTQCAGWTSCADDADVILCTTARGGHTWPGGVHIPVLGKTTDALSATETMISFFAAHPMP